MDERDEISIEPKCDWPAPMIRAAFYQEGLLLSGRIGAQLIRNLSIAWRRTPPERAAQIRSLSCSAKCA
jgi:hypothetical protein